MKRFLGSIFNWMTDLVRVWRREFTLVFGDVGVLLFFFFLTLVYPIIYTVIYNPEIVENLPVVVVDHSRTTQSRELARMVDATQSMEVYDYANDLAAARRFMNEHRCYGILEIPADYGRQIGRGEQGVVTFYSEMSLLLRYRAFVASLTDVQMALGSKIQTREINTIGLPAQAISGTPVDSEAVMLGDPTQGFASFIIPGIVILILQQSMLLGVTMLAAGSSERRRRNRGYDPMAVDASPATSVLGKTCCYVLLYIPICIYVLDLVPRMFNLPHIGNPAEYLMFIVPMLVATSFLGITLSVFVRERESSLLVIVFTSVVFLFLSGLTWPRYAMSPFWKLLSDCIPATWGVNGFVRMNSNGASLWQQAPNYYALWILSALYFVSACLVTAYLYPRNRFHSVSENVKNGEIR